MTGVSLSPSAAQTQSQRMILSQRLRQSLEMLAMNLPELRAELNREMEMNPVIDGIDHALERATISEKEREAAVGGEAASADYPDDDSAPDPVYTADADSVERRQRFFDSQTAEETLEEHLSSQIKTSDIAPADYPLAEMLIGELNDDGLFAGSMPDLIMVTGESEAKIREVLSRIMQLDPPGCGATSVSECLLAQIDKLDSSPFKDDVRMVLERGLLRSIGEGRIADVERALGVSHERYADILSALRTLDPRPARAYSRSGKGVAYVNPEVHAVKTASGYAARVDARSVPEIRISKSYLKMLDDPSLGSDVKAYLRSRIEAVEALREALDKREETITAIAQAIFDAQGEFFKKGLKGLKPLTMQEIAEKVGVHVATVSRTVNDKYVLTPRGVVELRRFFVSGLATESGEVIARDAVVDALKEIVATENSSKPYSDEKISALLKDKAFAIARRTVAKYRIQLGIPSASDRRILITLASGSPRRSKILSDMGCAFEIVKSDAPEVSFDDDPERTVRENALAKGAAVARRGRRRVLSADTIVWFNGKIYGKPADLAEAKAFLRALSGNVHTVYTAVAFDGDVEVVKSNVKFRKLTEEMIDEYVAKVNPVDRAGAYDIDESGKLIVESWTGSYENIMGLPIEPLRKWAIV